VDFPDPDLPNIQINSPVLISKFIPGYQLFPKDDPLVILDKILWYVGWAVVVSALLLIVALIIIIVYINQAPTNALRLLIS